MLAWCYSVGLMMDENTKVDPMTSHREEMHRLMNQNTGRLNPQHEDTFVSLRSQDTPQRDVKQTDSTCTYVRVKLFSLFCLAVLSKLERNQTNNTLMTNPGKALRVTGKYVVSKVGDF